MINMKGRGKKGLYILLAGIAVLPAALIAPGRASGGQKAHFMGRNYAHRGLHTRDLTVPENSLAAFRRAIDCGYGVELDVQLSRDGKVVVFHDDTLDRVCHVSGRVEDHAYSELRRMPLQNTEERIPLFTDVLFEIDGRGPIICELKSGKRNRELCQKTYDMICRYHGDICIESFDPFIVAWFRFHAPELLRGQLAMPMEHYDKSLNKALSFSLSNCLTNCLARPHFVAYRIGRKAPGAKLCDLMGAIRTAWTSHEPESEKGNDMVIFEFYRPKPFFK